MRKWICISYDHRSLWTADLFDGEQFVENLGGSYPGCRSAMIDAKKTWGSDLNIRIIPEGYIPKYKGEIE